MFSDSQTDTRIFNFDNQTIVLSRIKGQEFKFRIYQDGAFKSYVEKIDDVWVFSASNSLSMKLHKQVAESMGI